MPVFGANISCPSCSACWSLKPPKRRKSLGNSLHPQAWELVKQGRIGTQRAEPAVSGPPDTRSGDSRTRSESLGSPAECLTRPGDVAVYHDGCTDQAQAALSVTATLTDY